MIMKEDINALRTPLIKITWTPWSQLLTAASREMRLICVEKLFFPQSSGQEVDP